MAKFHVRSPMADHTGAVGGVSFAHGYALVDEATHAPELDYCRLAGYHVERAEDVATASVPVEVVAKPRRNGSAEAWKAYAVSQGMPAEEADSLTRDQLAERFASVDEETPQ